MIILMMMNNRTTRLQKTKSRVVNKRWQVEVCIIDRCFDSCLSFDHSLWNSCLFFFGGPFLNKGMKVAARSLPPIPRSGELRTQKLKSHLVRTQSLNVLPFKPGAGQYIAIHATPTAREFFLAYFYPSNPFTGIFSKTSPNFFLRWPAE